MPAAVFMVLMKLFTQSDHDREVSFYLCGIIPEQYRHVIVLMSYYTATYARNTPCFHLLPFKECAFYLVLYLIYAVK